MSLARARVFWNLARPYAQPYHDDPTQDAGFDPLVFWIQHKGKIVPLALLMVIALAVYGISEYVRIQKNTTATALFAKAETADAFRKIVTDYPGTAVAGNATLMLAEKLRQEGKFDESSTVLRTFIEKNPEHQFVSGAWTSIAANLEAQGKPDEALTIYQKVSTAYANSFSAPAAFLAQARIMAAKGKPEDARRIYDLVMTQYRDNNGAAQQAAQELRRLKK